MTDIDSAEVQLWGRLSLPTLAKYYNDEYLFLRSVADYHLRQPLERRAECIWAIGRFRFPNDWSRALDKFDWPEPVSQHPGGRKTNPGFDREPKL